MDRRQLLKSLTLTLTGGIMKLNALNQLTSHFENTETMPLLFLGHRSPMNTLADNTFTRGFRVESKQIGKPRAILCISAHWETRGTYITAMDKPQTIHDFGGFPPALYQVQYPAPGSPELAKETKALVDTTEIQLTDDWGLDHGAWSVIKHLYPEADVPVVEMSIDFTRNPQYHFNWVMRWRPCVEKGC